MTKQEKEANWKKIGPLPGMLYAEMVAEVLTQRQIPHYISQDGVSAAYGVRATSVVGNKAFIYVPEAFEQEVREIVESMLDHI